MTTSAATSHAPGAEAASTKQFATFMLDQYYFGVEVLKVQEVIRYQDMTHVPLAPSVVRGLINLRGQIVTAIDLRHRLELPVRHDGEQPMNVVVRTSDGVVSLLVDEIGDVVEAAASDFEPAPDTIRGAARELVTGVYKLKDSLLLALDVERTASLDGDGGDRRN
ncbi:MAG: chemotaxis protein CheW [Vicinamibacterales bacterium]